MAIDRQLVDWSSKTNQILLNPRWPTEDQTFLNRLAENVLTTRNLHAHLVLASSGTSAGSWREIKLVFLPKQAVLAAAESVVKFFSLGPKDVFAQTLPEFHVSGLGVGARAFVSGGRVVNVLPAGEWNPSELLTSLRAHKATVLSLVPTQLHDLVELKATAPESLRHVFIGGGVLPPTLEKAARDFGWPLVVTYGMTETSAMCAVRTETSPDLGFQILPHADMQVTATGFLKVRGPSLATGFAREIAGKLHWTAVADEQGWFVTEDRGRLVNSRCFVEGRGRDFIKVGGESVNLNGLRGILDSLATAQNVDSSCFHLMARPSQRLGAEIILVYEEGQIHPEALADSFNQKVLPFERIRENLPIPALPRTDLGKVREEQIKILLEGKGDRT